MIFGSAVMCEKTCVNLARSIRTPAELSAAYSGDAGGSGKPHQATKEVLLLYSVRTKSTLEILPGMVVSRLFFLLLCI